MGDTNCDFFFIEGSGGGGHSSHLKELYDLFGLKQIIEEPTRVTLVTSTLIGHISTSNINNISESGAIKTTFSDHFLVYCKRKFRGGIKRQHRYLLQANEKLQ